MPHRVIDADRRALALRVLVLLARYSTDISAIAMSTLGEGMASNKDIAVLLAVEDARAVAAGDLARLTGMSASDVSRSLGRLQRRGLVTRERTVEDRRVVVVTPTQRGLDRVRGFGSRLGDYFVAAAPTVKEILDLLGWSRPRPRAAISALAAARGLADAGRGAAASLDRAGRPYGVTSRRDRFAVALLSQHPYLRPGQVATELHLSRSSATEFLDRLERLGLVSRSADPRGLDHRAVLVTLTPRGRRSATRLALALEGDIELLAPALAATLGPFAAE